MSAWPQSSCFSLPGESSGFFEGGSVGYSATLDCCRRDGMQLQTKTWHVQPLTVEHVESSFFNDESAFPRGSVEFHHALIMRDVPHRWQAVPELLTRTKTNEQKRAAAYSPMQ